MFYDVLPTVVFTNPLNTLLFVSGRVGQVHNHTHFHTADTLTSHEHRWTVHSQPTCGAGLVGCREGDHACHCQDHCKQIVVGALPHVHACRASRHALSLTERLTHMFTYAHAHTHARVNKEAHTYVQVHSINSLLFICTSSQRACVHPSATTRHFCACREACLHQCMCT